MNTYPGTELMKHPDLDVNLSITGQLLKPESLKKLEEEYLKTMERNYEEWLPKTLETEKQEWYSGTLPDEDDTGRYQTSSPVIIFQMIDQNLQVTNTINSEITFNALVLSIQQVAKYKDIYRLGVIDFKDKYFKDRSQIPLFTQHMISIVNNCQSMINVALRIKQLYWPKNKTNHYTDFEDLLKNYESLKEETASYLLEEAFLDIENQFNELFTIKWITESNPIDTICETLKDYFEDYKHLSDDNFKLVINNAQRQVTKRYIKAMLSKRLSKTKPECDIIAKKVLKESNQLKIFFEKNLSRCDMPLELIPKLINIITSDFEMVIFDLNNLLANYPSITEEQLVRLFYLRNDIKVNEVKEKYQYSNETKVAKVNIDKEDNIFREIIFNDKLW